MKNYFKEFMKDNGLKDGDKILIDNEYEVEITSGGISPIRNFHGNINTIYRLDSLLIRGQATFVKIPKYEEISLREAFSNYYSVFVKVEGNYHESKFWDIENSKGSYITIKGINKHYHIKKFTRKFKKLYKKVNWYVI